MDDPDTENPAQYNTITNKIAKEINTDLLNPYQSISPMQPCYPQPPQLNPIDEIDNFNYYREIIYDNIVTADDIM